MAQNFPQLPAGLLGCTGVYTQKNYFIQQWATCRDCFLPGEGGCMYCLLNCHKGHDIGQIVYSGFYCDCLLGSDRCTKSSPVPYKPKPAPYQAHPASPSPPSTTPVYDPITTRGAYAPALPGLPYVLPSPHPFTFCQPIDNPLGPTNPPTTLKSFTYDSPAIPAIKSTFPSTCSSLVKKMFSLAGSNIVFSPLSISYILSLVHQGSNGETNKQISTVLGGKNLISDLQLVHEIFNDDVVSLANVILVNRSRTIERAFKENISELTLLADEDFTNPSHVSQLVNTFVEMHTRGLIKHILKPEDISANDLMTLVNTLYFKTVWLKPFEARCTHKATFAETLTVDMMYQKDHFKYFEDNFEQRLEMLYKGEQYVMGFILPKNNNGFHPNFDTQPMAYEEVEVSIPKFTQRSQINLKPIFQQMGVIDLFDQSRADLSGISKDGAYVSGFWHESVVVVEECGVTASSVTTMVVQPMCFSMKPPCKVFNVNRPFYYYIKHVPTDTLLFVSHFSGK